MPVKQPQGTPRLLKQLRSLRVLLVHPNDRDGQELMLQLQRIGCQVKAVWPPSEKTPDEADLFLLAVHPEGLSLDIPWLKREDRAPIIAVVTYENPTIVEAVLELDADGIIASPVKSFGLLSTIVLALHHAENKRSRDKYVRKLEQRLTGLRKIAKAKAILMQTQNISEQQAYQIIRTQAMSKRVTTDEICDAVIKANEILGPDSKSVWRGENQRSDDGDLPP